MNDTPAVGAFAIVPCNDLSVAKAFWARMGFEIASDYGEYVIVAGRGCEVHLTPVGGDWAVQANNPFGIFIRTPQVDEVAARVDDLIIRPGGVLRHREWGMYEFGLNGPDGMLVRVGWPSRLIGGAK